ncbi:glycoside hydrolase family 130 protein [Sphingomonas sp. RP10(2022)]|uniref:Glycoside hydrolase family 130 protein n=1 Tax=Sphingomonas liriopis TaxID=2949094 RepID=A0A9X2HY63_9SPHN|nr:glycoside hydrolase family 130 protein [Sphingomonas liriopis]MCP3735559.1 glycoside hydrolase family 130 protein [Sphingomonas liriopis]
MAASFVHHLEPTLLPDPKRTVIRPFLPGDPDPFRVEGQPRGDRIVARLLALPDNQIVAMVDTIVEGLGARHREIPALLLRRFAEVAEPLKLDPDLPENRKMLIGGYFSAEYSFEAAALFNPSIVPHPDQGDCADGAIRFVLSLRGIGEGHLSSVTFRTGTWGPDDDDLVIDPPGPQGVPPVIEEPDPELVRQIGAKALVQLNCRDARDPSETVLFPVVESQSRGIEDVRLVQFRDDDGQQTYLGSYTAVSAEGARQEVMQTDDFRLFHMHPVDGPVAPGKGMALFPRKVGGKFAALFRHDNENLWYATSDTPLAWADPVRIMTPQYPWEFIQIGNCGSPIEIDEGWLVLTHGVGMVRSYCIGAALLDRDDPTKVLGRMAEPLIAPDGETWDGYVPNVVYSCGGLVRGRTLLLPYALADDMTSFATAPLDKLLAAMR